MGVSPLYLGKRIFHANGPKRPKKEINKMQKITRKDTDGEKKRPSKKKMGGEKGTERQQLPVDSNLTVMSLVLYSCHPACSFCAFCSSFGCVCACWCMSVQVHSSVLMLISHCTCVCVWQVIAKYECIMSRYFPQKYARNFKQVTGQWAWLGGGRWRWVLVTFMLKCAHGACICISPACSFYF